MALNVVFRHPIDWITDEERFRMKEVKHIIRDREMYIDEVLSYVYGDNNIPVELRFDPIEIRVKYLQSN